MTQSQNISIHLQLPTKSHTIGLHTIKMILQITIQTRNQKHRPNTVDSAYRQDIVLVYQEGVNYYLNSNHTYSISRKVCVRLFTLCKISTAILRILWRHLPTELKMFSAFRLVGHLIEKISLTINRARCRLINQ